jgi:hypothetical protein
MTSRWQHSATVNCATTVMAAKTQVGGNILPKLIEKVISIVTLCFCSKGI